MNKFILIDKVQDKTSFDVIRWLKKEFDCKDFGHTGTLDPIATGLLVIAVGKEALKAIRFVNAEDKEYVATIKLGLQTDTADITGKVIKDKKVRPCDDLNTLFKSFVGKRMQMPPAYSAKKIKGKRAYDLARSGQKVNLEAVEIEIKELELISYNLDEIKFRTLVSKGTFIRVLCEEIACATGNIGTMSSLRRTKVGNISIDDIEKNKFVEISDMINLPKINITKEEFDKIKLGQRFYIKHDGILALLFNKKLVSVVKVESGQMQIIRNFNLI